MLQLIIALLPTLVSFIHLTEVKAPQGTPGSVKKQTVLDMFVAMLETIMPAQKPVIDALSSLCGPLINVIVAVCNLFGWNKDLIQQATNVLVATTDGKQAPAPVVELSKDAVTN